MTWFFAVLLVAVMGVTALVAAGRGGSMADVHGDRPDARVPADGPLTAVDLEEVRFTTALRGYRMAEVDALLDRLVNELREREGADGMHGPDGPDGVDGVDGPDHGGSGPVGRG